MIQISIGKQNEFRKQSLDSSGERRRRGGTERSGLLQVELRFPAGSAARQDQPQILRSGHQNLAAGGAEGEAIGGVA